MIEGTHDVLYEPTASVGSYDTTSSYTAPWDVEMAGTGTVTVKTPTQGDINVSNGTVKISALPCAGITSTSGTGNWSIDETLSLSAGQIVHGAFATGGTLSFDFGANGAGEYAVLEGCGLSEGDITVTTSLDGDNQYTVSRDWSGGNLTLTLMPVGARIAEWTGGGTAENPFDTANWRVTDGTGTEIPGAVPNASTFIRLAGATALSFPQTEGFTYAGLMLTDGVSLVADCDWSGLGTVAFRDGTWIDLLGHRLDITGFTGVTAGMAGVTDSTMDAEHPGELHIRVAEDATFTNDKVALNGNLRLVKEGLGTFVATKANQKYTGGTEIVAGTLKCGAKSSSWPFGGDGNKNEASQIITVDRGATLDINGMTAFGYITIVFNGGTVKGASTQFNCAKRLTDDSYLEVTGDMKFQTHPLVLDRHTLEVSITSAKNLIFDSCSPEGPGKIDIKSGGYLLMQNIEHVATNVDFVVGSALKINTASSVHDYEAVFNGNYNLGAAALNVHGTFKPSAHDCFYGCTMMDGSTIDLTNRTTPLPLTSAFTDSGLKTLSFANGATIRVKVDGRSFSGRTVKVMSWNEPPANVTFVSAGNGTVKAEADGLYFVKGGTVLSIH